MKQTLVVALLLFATAALAVDAPREIFPSDYEPHICAPQDVCQSFTNISFAAAASHFLLRSMDSAWVDGHRDEMMKFIGPHCTKRATCMASPGREFWFCNDVFAQELRNECRSRYPDSGATHHDFEQCLTFVDTYSAGVDQRGSADWKAAQACAAKSGVAPAGPGKMEWWSVPAVIGPGYRGDIQIFTIDTLTHVPVGAEINIDGQTVYSTDAPTGRAYTYYLFKWPRRLKRVQRADGHSDVIAPPMTLTAAGYETLTATVPTNVPKMVVSLFPKKLRKGRNTVKITTVDEGTGAPVEAQVMYGESTAGATNQPIKLEIPRDGKHPDIWVTSPFNTYSDVVVVPAVK